MICGGENDINSCHLATFTVDVAFDFKATRSPHNLSPYRSASGIGYDSENYLNWQPIQLAIHSMFGE